MPVSKRVRFEVFKRDDFACQYCGRKTPAVVLEVDHVIPRAEGGGDDMENLLTSCFDCNRGKGPKPLGDIAVVVDVARRAQEIHEREEQLRAYNEVKRQQRERIEGAFDECWDHWFSLWRQDKLPSNCVPWEKTLRFYLRKLPAEDVKEAMTIALDRIGFKPAAVRYFVGICKRKLAAVEGRETECSECDAYIELTAEQVAAHGLGGWRCGNPCGADE